MSRNEHQTKVVLIINLEKNIFKIFFFHLSKYNYYEVSINAILLVEMNLRQALHS